MRVPPDYTYNADLLGFANKTKSRFINLLENEIEQLGAVRAQLAFKAEFSIVRQNSVRETMSHLIYPHLYQSGNADTIKAEFDRFVERTSNEIEAWSERGSGWILEKIREAYVSIARYQPLRGGTYLPIPAELQ